MHGHSPQNHEGEGGGRGEVGGEGGGSTAAFIAINGRSHATIDPRSDKAVERQVSPTRQAGSRGGVGWGGVYKNDLQSELPI